MTQPNVDLQYKRSPMKKQRGLVRNRYAHLQDARAARTHKEHRFKNIGKADNDDSLKENEEFSSSLLSTTQSQPQINDLSPVKTLYESVKVKLEKVHEIQQQMHSLSKTRLKSFKQEVTKDLDKKINLLAQEATQNILKADKEFKQLRATEPANAQQEKFIKNLERSLGWELRQLTKSLRLQENEYFNKIKSYEEGSHNTAIELTETQRNKMKDWDEDGQIMEEIEKQRDEQVNKLVASINGLTKVYKELGDLVLQQGTLIDRIDYNIDKAMDHTSKGVEQLRKAEKHQSSPFADRCIQILVGVIIVLAVIMGFKYSK